MQKVFVAVEQSSASKLRTPTGQEYLRLWTVQPSTFATGERPTARRDGLVSTRPLQLIPLNKYDESANFIVCEVYPIGLIELPNRLFLTDAIE
jgi:hypothetical protein